MTDETNTAQEPAVKVKDVVLSGLKLGKSLKEIKARADIDIPGNSLKSVAWYKNKIKKDPDYDITEEEAESFWTSGELPAKKPRKSPAKETDADREAAQAEFDATQDVDTGAEQPDLV